MDCQRCVDFAHEVAYDNMIDHVGIRIPAAEAQALGYNLRRELSPEEQAEAQSWAEGWLADGLLASLGSDCGNHEEGSVR